MRIRLLLCIVLLAGCGSSVLEQELSQAKQCMRSHPEQALRILESIDASRLSGRRQRARYSLLYSQALDKNYVDPDNDSLIRVAYRYYSRRICSDSLRFQLNYHYGRVCQNGADYSRAVGFYLTAERYARAVRKNYFLGLVYTRLGEVYSEQMNYEGMLEYYRKALLHFRLLGNTSLQNSAQLNLANAYFSLRDTTNARKYYAAALNLARKRADDEILAACLGNLGSIYAAGGNYSEARKAVGELGRLDSQTVSFFECTLLAEIYCGLHKLDSARHFLALARDEAVDLRDRAALSYLSFRIETADGNHAAAKTAIEKYIESSDSLSRLALYQSATAAERRFYKEQSEFADYRLQVRTYVGISLIVLIGASIFLIVYVFRQRIRRKQTEIGRYMAAVDHLRRSESRIISQLERTKGVESRLKQLVLSRFKMLDELGWAFYERENTQKQQAEVYRQVKSFMSRLSSDPATKKEMEEIIDTVNDNIIAKLRAQFPRFKASDIDLLCYIYAGFSAQIISLLTGDSVANIYNRKSRLKSRIANSDAPDKTLFLDNMT